MTRMRIAKIILHNVKSYAAHTTIDLAPGINAICGENGAGKSTILESIGYTLFGYRPYRLEAFLREGEKSGSITITVEDENGCAFDVVRKLGGSSGQSVYDELGQRIAEGEADVRRWLADFFHLEAGTDLGKLFEDAVGPPQGTLTAIFLESGAVRKQKFDRLLGIEDYRTAADGLKTIANIFRDEAADATARAAVLEGTASRLPEVEERQSGLVRRQAELGQELKGLLGRLEILAADRERLEAAKQKLRLAESQLSLARARAEDAARRKDDLAAQLARAEEAARVMEQSRPGHAAFQEASDRLRKLNGRRVERDQLRQRAEIAARAAITWEQQVASAVEQIAALDRDVAAAAELEAAIPEQETREQALRKTEELLRAREDARRQLAASEQRLASSEGRRLEAERRLAEVEVARPLANGLAGLREQERALLDDRARLAQQVDQINKDAGNLASSRAQLEQMTAEADLLTRQIEALRPLETLVAQFASRQQDRDGAASAVASLEGLHGEAVRTRAQVEGGLCPFFHERCKNLREGISLDAHFDGVVASTSTELASAMERLTLTEAALAESRSAEREYSRLPDLRRHLEQLTESRSKLDQEVDRLTRARSDLEGIPGEVQRVEAELLAVAPELARAEEAWRIVSAEESWRSQARDAAEAAESERKGAEEIRGMLEGSVGAEEKAAAAVASLAEMGDPRGQAAALRTRISRERPAAERTLERAQREAANARTAEERARAELEPYDGLEEELAGATVLRDGSQSAYNQFIANEAEASRLEERRTSYSGAVGEADQAEEGMKAAAEQVEALRTGYDEEADARTRSQIEELGARIGGVRTEMDLTRLEEERLREELAALRESRSQMEAAQRQAARERQLRDAVEAIRWALNAAGPEIARALLRRISDRATGLYRDLLGDPTVSLEWAQDYDIRCRIKADEREFKQLSGGEQMAAALAVRLALLQTISGLRVSFLDEPTAHMDATRRTNLAAQIQNLRSFDQLVVISHDDSFDTLFGHVVRLIKRDGVTAVED